MKDSSPMHTISSATSHFQVEMSPIVNNYERKLIATYIHRICPGVSFNFMHRINPCFQGTSMGD
jgi:hypothetical protein